MQGAHRPCCNPTAIPKTFFSSYAGGSGSSGGSCRVSAGCWETNRASCIILMMCGERTEQEIIIKKKGGGVSDHVCVTAWLHMGPHRQKVEWKPPLLISVLDVCVFQAALPLTAAHLHLRLFPQTVIGRGDIAVNTLLSAISLTLNDSGHNRVIALPFIFTILDISALYYPPSSAPPPSFHSLQDSSDNIC